MGNRKRVICFHLVWSVRKDCSGITNDIERPIYRCIVDQVHKLNCQVLAINGVLDHIHLVVKVRSTVSIAHLVKQAKGVSAMFANDQLVSDGNFRWEPGYGAFTVSRWDLEKIINYVKKQKRHHQVGSLLDDLE